MPGVVQHTLESLVAAAREAADAGLGGLMLFGVPAAKDAVGSGADDPDGILNVALRAVADAVGDRLVVMADLCLDEFTDHGHCGVLDRRTAGVDNDATLERYAAMGLAQARAGAHVLGLSGMMDGQVALRPRRARRRGLHRHRDPRVCREVHLGSLRPVPRGGAVLARRATGRPTSRTRPTRPRRCASSSSTSPRAPTSSWSSRPTPHLDIVAAAAAVSTVPVAAYQISGEYSMIEAASANGWIDRDRAIMESLLNIRRAGAQIILTYYAIDAAALL